jgi:hypothetical protein
MIDERFPDLKEFLSRFCPRKKAQKKIIMLKTHPPPFFPILLYRQTHLLIRRARTQERLAIDTAK